MWRLRNKVMLGVLGVITLIVVCGVALVYKKEAEMIQKDYCYNLYSRVEQAGNYFDDMMISIYEISAKIAYEEDLLQAVKEFQNDPTEETTAKLSRLLVDYKMKNMEISSICVYMDDMKMLITSEEYPMVVEHPSLELMGGGTTNPMLLKIPYKKEGHMLSFVQRLNRDLVGNTSIMVNVQERSIYYSYLDYLDSDKVQVIALVGLDEEVISTKERGAVGTLFNQALFDNSGNEAVIKGSKGEKIGISYKAPFSQYRIRLVVSTDEIMTQLSSLRIFVLILSFIFIGVAFLFSYFSTLFIHKPLNQLTETVKAIGKGDLNLRYVVTTKDEVGTLGTNFNNMLDQINALFQQLIKEEQLKKDAELDALQYQITPHFMYNTLNSIKCYALTREEKEIAELIANFADLLRTAISKNGVFITLKEELDIVDKYVKLQQFRYGDKFSIDYQFDPSIDYYIPRLILQPFVENSIEHGFDMRRSDNKILICAETVAEHLLIKISDNGTGMSQGLIDKLLNSPAKKMMGMSSIGIANVKERLELYFGQECQVNMSATKRGLEVKILIPAITSEKELQKYGWVEGEEDVQGTYS